MTNKEFVNSYLDNELPKTERLDFENKLQHDSELKEEYNFQNDIVEGIKETRRLELKSRLSNIPVSTPIYQTIGFKAIAVASLSTGIGLGVYYLMDKNNIQLSDVDLSHSQITLTQDQDVPEIPKAITPIVRQETKEEKVLYNIPQNKTSSEVVTKNTEAKVEPNILQPNVIQPDVVETFEDEDINSEDISAQNPINDLDNIKDNVESTVEIATVKDKRNKFHYQFYKNKLYLLGNFNEMPYEIIELNSEKSKKYFLYYNDSFYKLEPGQEKPAPLVKIENDSLVNELKIIQLNQSY